MKEWLIQQLTVTNETCIIAAMRASGESVVEVKMRIFDTGFTREHNPAYQRLC